MEDSTYFVRVILNIVLKAVSLRNGCEKRMLIKYLYKEDPCAQDQRVQGLGFIYRRGFNFLPTLVRLEELLSGKYKFSR